MHKLWQPGSLAARKWRENEEMNRKWRENEEMYTDSLSIFPHFLIISSLSFHFLYQKLSHFVAKYYIGHFFRKCHKKVNIRAMRKQFWIEFAARKLRKL